MLSRVFQRVLTHAWGSKINAIRFDDNKAEAFYTRVFFMYQYSTRLILVYK